MAQLQNIEAIEKRLWSAADNLRANSNYASNGYSCVWTLSSSMFRPCLITSSECSVECENVCKPVICNSLAS